MELTDKRIEKAERKLIKDSRENLVDRLNHNEDIACPNIYEPLPDHYVCKRGVNVTDVRKCDMSCSELKDSEDIYQNRCYKVSKMKLKEMYLSEDLGERV